MYNGELMCSKQLENGLFNAQNRTPHTLHPCEICVFTMFKPSLVGCLRHAESRMVCCCGGQRNVHVGMSRHAELTQGGGGGVTYVGIMGVSVGWSGGYMVILHMY